MLTSAAHVFVASLKSEGFIVFVEHILSPRKCKLDRGKCPELCRMYFLANIGLMKQMHMADGAHI